ncbi:MAG: alpha/beta hydrolase-fold protein [Betaproteobacteria bacterium]|jgi:phospholipase/carboxylesterase
MENYLETIELETAPHPTASVIWMHGLGADGNDFVPIVQELQLNKSPSIRFIFPHAPKIPVTINNGFIMRAWYDVSPGDLGEGQKKPDENGIRKSQAQIGQLIEREIERGTPSERIVLAGFSQGGVISLQTALRYPKPLAGVMALSCYLSCTESFEKEASAANAKIPAFMAHGTEDPVVPYSMGASAAKRLQDAHYTVHWHEYPMPHSVCMEEVRDISQWLNQCFSQS